MLPEKRTLLLLLAVAVGIQGTYLDTHLVMRPGVTNPEHQMLRQQAADFGLKVYKVPTSTLSSFPNVQAG